MRNQCAHGIDKHISATDVETIGLPLGKVYTEYRRKYSASVPVFLHHIFSYLAGSLAGQVTRTEAKKIADNTALKKEDN